jgi:hypothetical protein
VQIETPGKFGIGWGWRLFVFLGLVLDVLVSQYLKFAAADS